jgi:MoaA/NifB/PqqE/SkfB family radical SAM enzyme
MMRHFTVAIRAVDIDRITGATTLREFYAAVRDADIVDPGARFLHLEMDITSRCNIRCVMCYHSLEAFARGKAVLMPADRFETIAASVLSHAHTLTLSLGSEPMTSPHFVPILRAAAAHRVPRVGFFTNGTLLDGRIAAEILDANVTDVSVSVDGATAATYEAIRRGASFDAVIGNVRGLIAARAARGRAHPRVRFDLVMMKRNVHELPAFVDLAAALGVDAINFFHMVAYDGLRMEEQSLQRHQDLADLWLERAVDRAAALGIPIASMPRTFADARRTPAAAGDVYAETPYCRYPFFHISMNSGGHVLPCPFSHGEAPFGTVDDDTPFEAIWLGSRFSDLRRRILEHDPPAMCRRCSYLASRYPDIDALFAHRAASGASR